MNVIQTLAVIGAVVAILIGVASIWRSWGWDRTGVLLGATAVALGTLSLMITAFRLGYAGWP